jgi:hypothetical protein
VEFQVHTPAVIVNVIVNLDGSSATVPVAGLMNAISCITDSFCVPAESTEIVDFCKTPVAFGEVDTVI